MDLLMPIMDGWQATKIIRASEGISHIPIICLTARLLEGDKEKILAAGFDEIQTKPVISNELLEKIYKLLPSTI